MKLIDFNWTTQILFDRKQLKWISSVKNKIWLSSSTRAGWRTLSLNKSYIANLSGYVKTYCGENLAWRYLARTGRGILCTDTCMYICIHIPMHTYTGHSGRIGRALA